jgi:hypothetical protein
MKGVYNVTVTVIPGTCAAGATCTGNIEASGHDTCVPFRGFEEISTASDNERVLLLVGVSKGANPLATARGTAPTHARRVRWLCVTRP